MKFDGTRVGGELRTVASQWQNQHQSHLVDGAPSYQCMSVDEHPSSFLNENSN